MTEVKIRLVFAAIFCLAALFGAIAMELLGHDCPPWLVGLVGAAGGYIFGHVQANGITGTH